MLNNISTIISEKGKKVPADTCRKSDLSCKIADYSPSAKVIAKYVADHPESVKRLPASSSSRFPALRNVDNALLRAAGPSSSTHSTLLRDDRPIFSCPVPVAKQDDQPRPLPVRNTGTLRGNRYRNTVCPCGLHPARSKWFQGRWLILKNISTDSTHSEATKRGSRSRSRANPVQVSYITINTITYKSDK